MQIDEPILVLDLPAKWQRAFESVYNRLQHNKLKVLLATYFGALGENLSRAVNLPVAGLHIDAVRAPEQLLAVVDRLPFPPPYQTRLPPTVGNSTYNT